MPIRASEAILRFCTTSRARLVYPLSNGLKVDWIDAAGDAAKMVDLHACGNRATRHLVRDAVSAD
jgi:hypothetical protein